MGSPTKHRAFSTRFYSRGAVPLFVLAMAAVQPTAARPVEQNPFSSAEDLAEGARLYLLNCGVCHGPHGASGRGAKLATKRRKHGASDAEMFRNILDGIAGTEMPGLWLDGDAVWKILLFVRTLEPESERACMSAGGDPERGRELFVQKGRCSSCHTVGMGGGRLGPDLSDAAMTYTREQIREALVDPHKTIAERHRGIKVVDRAGDSHEGILLNEDAYSLHMMDRAEQIRSFVKQDLASFERLDHSLMPVYGNILSAAELDNITAYVCSLGGEQP